MGNGQSAEPVVANRKARARFSWCLSWVGWACLPSFSIAYVSSLGVLLACVTWILCDAGLRDTVVQLYLVVIFEALRDVALATPYFTSGVFGPRITALLLLSLLCIWSTCVVAFRLFVGKRGGRSVRSWMLATALCAAWLSLWVSYDSLNWWGIQLRVPEALPRFEAAAAVLREDWPTESVTLPEAGKYYNIHSPGILLCGDIPRLASRHEELGWLIYPIDNGVLRFMLLSDPLCFVEQHPPGSPPASFADEYDGSGFSLRNAVHLRDSWYLARYE